MVWMVLRERRRGRRALDRAQETFRRSVQAVGISREVAAELAADYPEAESHLGKLLKRVE